MTCDVARNRLLALPDPAQPSDDLLPHLAACAACRRVQAEAVRLDRLLKRLPVPDSSAAKAAVLAELDAAGPVIRSRPVVPSTLAGSGSFKPITKWLKRIDWRYAGGGVAAAVAIGLVVLFFTSKKTDDPPVAEVPRSELLAKVVKHNTTLAGTAHTPDARLSVYAEWTADVNAETRGVYKIAAAEEMNSLAEQYELVSEAVVAQANELTDENMPVSKRLAPQEKSQLLRDAMKKLGDAEADARDRAADAPANARPALDRIAKSANEARMALGRIATAHTPNARGDQP